MNILVGDIGGTKTILAVAHMGKNHYELHNVKTYRSGNYNNLEDLIGEYINVAKLSFDHACLAVAGPVANKRANITNLPWIVSIANLQSTLNISSLNLINDLEAIASSIPFLKESDITSIYEGAPKNGNIAVIAPGTGLGEAFLTFDRDSCKAYPSEGSHATFSPINETQIELLKYIQKKYDIDHVSVERVCSGAIGLPNIYNFIKETNRATEPDWLATKFAVQNDLTPIIIDSALSQDKNCEICSLTLQLFCEILAAEAGNLALKVLATGGIYIAGGISARIIKELQKPYFIKILQQKGRFKELLRTISVNVITNRKVGLIGAMHYSEM